MGTTDRILLRLHIEAVWHVRLSDPVSNDVELLPGEPQPDWRLCAANLSESRVHVWRSDVSSLERQALRQRVSEALVGSPVDTPLPGVHREVALSLAASPKLSEVAARSIARPLDEADRPLVEAFDSGFLSYYFNPARHPLIGVVIAGQLLSVAHSSRRTPEACELGVYTLAQARHKGYALAATVMWTQAVLQEQLVPLYSADASNTASLRLADASGYRAFAQIATFE